MQRRQFTKILSSGTAAFMYADGLFNLQAYCAAAAQKPRKILYLTKTGKIGMVDENGENNEYLNFNVPEQINWGVGPSFHDGEQILLTSYEKGKSWEGNVKTHIWIYNHRTKELTRILEEKRPCATTYTLPACSR